LRTGRWCFAPEQLVIPTYLVAEDFGSFSREALGEQLTYFTSKPSQLYYFKNDQSIRGNVTGLGLGNKFIAARFQF